MCQLFIFRFRRFFLSTPQEKQQESYLTQEMVWPIQCPFIRVTLFLTLSRGTTLRVVIWMITCKSFWLNSGLISTQQHSWRSSGGWKRSCATLRLIMSNKWKVLLFRLFRIWREQTEKQNVWATRWKDYLNWESNDQMRWSSFQTTNVRQRVSWIPWTCHLLDSEVWYWHKKELIWQYCPKWRNHSIPWNAGETDQVNCEDILHGEAKSYRFARKEVLGLDWRFDSNRAIDIPKSMDHESRVLRNRSINCP